MQDGRKSKFSLKLQDDGWTQRERNKEKVDGNHGSHSTAAGGSCKSPCEGLCCRMGSDLRADKKSKYVFHRESDRPSASNCECTVLCCQCYRWESLDGWKRATRTRHQFFLPLREAVLQGLTPQWAIVMTGDRFSYRRPLAAFGWSLNKDEF